MSAKTISKQLLNSRARIYHSGAASWDAGWLYDVELPDLWITASAPLPIGSSLTLAVQTEKSSIHFMARLEEVDREETRHRLTPIFLGNGVTVAQPEQYCYRLALTSPIRQLPSQQSDRKAVADFNVTLLSQFEETPVRVWDMSRLGACVHSCTPPDTSARHEVLCEIEGKEVVLPASLRHTRKVPAPEPLYATGIMLEGFSRVDGARWNTRYQEAVSVPSRAGRHAAPVLVAAEETAPAPQTSRDLLEQVTEILDKMRRTGQTERTMVMKHLRDVQISNVEEVVTDLETKLELLVKYERELERDLLDTVHKLHAGTPAA